MALSKETKRTINQRLVKPVNDYYPDRSATDLTIKGESTLRLPFDDFPRTTEDMSKMFTWSYGDDEISGSDAKNNEYYKEYKKDIEVAVSEKGSYKDLYIDTTKLIGDQLAGK